MTINPFGLYLAALLTDLQNAGVGDAWVTKAHITAVVAGENLILVEEWKAHRVLVVLYQGF